MRPDTIDRLPIAYGHGPAQSPAFSESGLLRVRPDRNSAAPRTGCPSSLPCPLTPTRVSAPTIQRVQPQRPRGLKVLIHLDDGNEPFQVMLEALERSRLGVGDPLPASVRRKLLDLDADVRVRDAALNLISYRSRTRRELQRKLRRKGFEHARIDPCLDRLQERGFIDDGAVAAAFVRDRLRHKPRGKARLSQELREKGVQKELADDVIGQVFHTEEVSDVDLARGVAAGWVNRQNPANLQIFVSSTHSKERDRLRRRLHGFLARRGFRGEAISAAMAEARSRAEEASTG